MRVEFSRIAGDIYVNGQKLIFAVDFHAQSSFGYENVDWLMGWAKIGLMSRGHTVPHFEMRSVESYELGALPPPSEPQGITGENEMKSESLEATEAECAAGRTAPRISLGDIEASIKNQYYIRGDEAAAAAGGPAPNNESSLSVLTICILELQNGFNIIGKAAPASPENFNADLGKKLAYEDAVRQIWPLMGFSLRDRLTADLDKQDATYSGRPLDDGDEIPF